MPEVVIVFVSKMYQTECCGVTKVKVVGLTDQEIHRFWLLVIHQVWFRAHLTINALSVPCVQTIKCWSRY